MPQYAILQSHPPDNCPMTNKAVREFALKNLPELPAKAEKAGVKVLLNIHLDPAHKAMLLLDAPSAEVARDLLFDSGFMHFTEMEFYLVTPIEELIQKTVDLPTVY